MNLEKLAAEFDLPKDNNDNIEFNNDEEDNNENINDEQFNNIEDNDNLDNIKNAGPNKDGNNNKKENPEQPGKYLDLNEDENHIENEENDEQFDENDSDADNRFPVREKGGWINWFCQSEGNDYFVEIDEDFIKDKGNLIGIDCEKYLPTLLSQNPPAEESFSDDMKDDAFNLKIKEIYGLIHRRFIMTPKGLQLMREKYLNEDYGTCPRVKCSKQMLLPIGLSEDPRSFRVKLFCPFCEEVYNPQRHRKKPIDIDGAYFGPSFPQVFLMNYPDLNPKNKKFSQYIPKIYGFKIFGKYGSKYYSRTKEQLANNKKKLNITLNDSEEEYVM